MLIKKKYSLYILLVFIAFIIVSCGNKHDSSNQKKAPDTFDVKTSFEKVNKKLVKTEDEEINDFITRYGWQMGQTGTGLRYMIYQKGLGAKITRGKIAKVNYNVRLITGELCYSSQEEGAKELLVGKSGDISGLEEGLLLLKAGDKAKFIIPSHLAYGFLGDENKIPKRATLVYDIQIIEIK